MKSPRPNRIAELRKARNLTQHDLAEMLGIHWITVSKLERGKMRLTYEWMARIAPALNVKEFELFAEREDRHKIAIEGSIIQGGRLGFYREIDGSNVIIEEEVELGVPETGGNAWIKVQDDSLYPYIHDGDIIRVKWQPSSFNPDNLIGRLCIVGTRDSDAAFIGILMRGRSPGLYDLHGTQGRPRTDLAVNQVARVSMILCDPGRFNRWIELGGA